MSVIAFPSVRIKRPSKQTWQRFLVRFFLHIGTRLQKMPRPHAMRWGDRLGDLAYQVAKRQRLYAGRNFHLTDFPRADASPLEREALLRNVFRSFGKTIIDFLIAPGLKPGALDDLISADGFAHVEAALARGKGVILITAHLGNWELLGRWLAQHGVPLTVIARDPEDPEFAAYVRGLRENGGVKVASKGGPVRELLGILKRGEAIGLLPDQNSGDLFAPFFGVPAGTVAGPATLALHTGAALVPTYCVRLPDDRYRLMILPPIDTTSTGSRDADLRRIMASVNLALESVIRQYPDQWLWIHNRWKSAFEKQNLARAWSAPAIEGDDTQNAADATENPAYIAARKRWDEFSS